MSYFLNVQDNFHFTDEGVTKPNKYDSLEEAIHEAEKIIRDEISTALSDGTKIKSLMQTWVTFGSTVTVTSDNSDERTQLFSSKQFANKTILELKKAKGKTRR